MELGWVAFAVANVAAMVRWESWETVPFHFIWVSLTLLYGFRVWRTSPTVGVLGAVMVVTAVLITVDVHHGTQEWGELTEVPLMSAMFLAMVWHARRRQQALAAVQRLAEQRASLLDRQEQFLHDASHELRTPVTVARGHLEVLRRLDGEAPEVAVALDELERIERIVERLLLLAKAEGPGSVALEEIELEPFLEDVFMRWAEVAARRWQLGELPGGALVADREGVRIALDALLENAVKYTEGGGRVSLSCMARDGRVAIEVADDGCGVPPEALERIFERFARSDPARSRERGGVGLGLAIVDTIARAHGGGCTAEAGPDGTVFRLELPGYRAPLAAPAGVRAGH